MKVRIGEEDETRFEMAPMIDMVFLLLIFFMCASHLSVVQSLPLEIPTAEHSVVPKERPDRFVVNITADGRLFGGNTPVDLQALKEMVRRQREMTPGIKIYLRADRDAAHKHVRKVMDAMGQIGVDDFIFGAFKPGG